MLMAANRSAAIVHYWAGKYPGRIGWIIGPRALPKTKLRPWIPYALDNDAFGAWTEGKPFDENQWLELLSKIKKSRTPPLWALVPDVVADRKATLESWRKYSPIAAEYGWPLAFAVQDGMTPDDVPNNATLVFIGGTTHWKWTNLPLFSRHFPRVHVGRVNHIRRLWTCEEFGVESVDGTGWFRETEEGKKIGEIETWLEKTTNPNLELFRTL